MKYFFIVIAVIMSAIFAFNAQLDVAGFRTGEVYPLAAKQGATQTLVSDRDYDQRSWVRARLEAACPTTLLLGSSTIGTMSAAMIGGSNVLNAWLTGPTVEDLEAVAQMLQVNDCRPARIIVGIDPFFVNPKVTSNRWRTVKDFQRGFVGAGATSGWLADTKSGWLRFTDRLAYQTTRDGVRLLAKGASRAVGPRLVRDLTTFCAKTDHPQSVRHIDGHFSYCPGWLKPVAEVEAIAATYVQRDVHKTRSWTRLSNARLARISGVLGKLQDRGAHLVLVTPTVHPLTYAALRADAHIAALLDQLDAALSALASRRGFAFVAVRDPNTIGCTTGQFFDSHHPAPMCARLLAAKISQAVVPAPAPARGQ